jgi:hypothetical protein
VEDALAAAYDDAGGPALLQAQQRVFGLLLPPRQCLRGQLPQLARVGPRVDAQPGGRRGAALPDEAARLGLQLGAELDPVPLQRRDEP